MSAEQQPPYYRPQDLKQLPKDDLRWTDEVRGERGFRYSVTVIRDNVAIGFIDVVDYGLPNAKAFLLWWPVLKALQDTMHV